MEANILKVKRILIFLFLPQSSRLYLKYIKDDKKYPEYFKAIICIFYAIFITLFISFLLK